MSGSTEQRLDARRVTSAAGDIIVVEGAEPIPIGTRVSVDPAQVGLGEPGAEPLRGKVINISRAAEGYAMTVKLHSVTRAQRDAIANSIR